jgi:hypothetical protein
MKIIINENQIRLLNEDLNTNSVSESMKETIALWCLTNDFRFIVADSVFGNKVNVANDERINKEICSDIINSISVTESNEEKELFGYNDYDDFEDDDDEREEFMNGLKIYKVETPREKFYIEVPGNLSEYDGEMMLQDYSDDLYEGNNGELIEWFLHRYR